ncbi:uncharacterized protein LOC125440480 [Sphaerodactylus townsendi]|nr:uncharacterized protein LOC125440480 [Sphaerodactylus townsendi]XP_048366265.1 uncharacterized protein LOC125440480 [Sphaerodactylus townsendi]XP_048366266.1 uncharacterized protein LOC125440480 [Sphaerodactylus townsendi]XP_048366267.1 uncharacterized protein LOC125440480 [Sphaerodactylus townsendi]XP_048366268.1 uncharacterized protein LOC125440480 [Sphaerodactylus townsendi]
MVPKGLKKMLSTLGALLLFSSAVTSTTSHFVIHYTSSGGICQNACGYHGYDYTWCNQSGGNGKKWDYCSLEKGLGASGQPCSSSCAHWGASYRSCYFDNGKWHYCGLIVQREHLEYSQENNLCLDNCRLDATVGYFQCSTPYGLQRCSPFHDITPTGLPCHSNYRCAKYGYSVYRCHTDDSEDKWDHCGQKHMNACGVWIHLENRTSLVEMCTLPYSHKKSKIIFHRERRKDLFPFVKEHVKMAVHLIDAISSTTSFHDSMDLEPVHFYKQESIFCKGLNYTNLELWVNISNSTSVPIAHVIFPDILKTVEVLRLAFYTSLHSTFYQPAYTIVVSVGEPMLCPPDL